ncbi:hypothetical protein LCGC14_1940290 [marine sediment metagenome]|uniref:Uncharacterized protein n=1 Tax=marine sediment metagenome TaxID=412755 RepID=A0A0F9FKF8_9ZZZZ
MKKFRLNVIPMFVEAEDKEEALEALGSRLEELGGLVDLSDIDEIEDETGNPLEALRNITKTYMDWYNTDLDEDVNAPETLYKIGETLQSYGSISEACKKRQ